MPAKGVVQVKGGVKYGIKEHLGNLWPVAILKEHHPEEKADKLTTVKHNNRIVKGVLKPKTLGWVEGVLELTRESVEEVEIVNEVASGETVASQAQLDRAFDLASKALNVDAKPATPQDGGTLKILAAAIQKRKASVDAEEDFEDDQDSLLARLKKHRLFSANTAKGKDDGNSIVNPDDQANVDDPPTLATTPAAGGRKRVASTEPAASTVPKAKSKAAAKASAKAAAKAAAAAAQASDAAVPGGRAMAMSKRIREVSSALPVVNEGQTIKNLLKTCDGLKSASAGQLSRVGQNLNKRLAPHRALAFFGSALDGFDCNLTDTLNEMKELGPSLLRLAAVAEAFHAKKTPLTSALALHNAYSRCVVAGDVIHESVMEEMLARCNKEAELAMDTNDWTCVVAIMSSESATSTASSSVALTLQAYPRDVEQQCQKAREIQRDLIQQTSKLIMDVSWEKDEELELYMKRSCSYLATLPDVRAKLPHDILVATKFVNPFLFSPENIGEAVKEVKQQQHFWRKCFTEFPVGVELLLRASRAQEQMEHDKLNDGNITILTSADDTALQTTVALARSDGIKDTLGKDLQKWRVVVAKLRDIETSSSDQFKDTNCDQIMAALDRVSAVAKACEALEAQKFMEILKAIAKECPFPPPTVPFADTPLALEVIAFTFINLLFII